MFDLKAAAQPPKPFRLPDKFWEPTPLQATLGAPMGTPWNHVDYTWLHQVRGGSTIPKLEAPEVGQIIAPLWKKYIET